jgi:hypothetical protein
MVETGDAEALEWIVGYLQSGAAKNPKGSRIYRVDPKYALPWIAQNHGVDSNEATERIDRLVVEVGGYRHRVVLDRSDEVRSSRATPPPGGWTEWHLPQSVIDELPRREG